MLVLVYTLKKSHKQDIFFIKKMIFFVCGFTESCHLVPHCVWWTVNSGAFCNFTHQNIQWLEY